MKLRILCVGKLSARFFKEGVEEYLARVKRYLDCEVVELKEGSAKKRDKDVAVAREGKAILARIPRQACAVVLDERGGMLSSEELAAWLAKKMVAGTGRVDFVIGGAYGLNSEIKKRADLLLSLSAMTLPHQMARLLLLEQIYRAFSIVRNEPYHNG